MRLFIAITSLFLTSAMMAFVPTVQNFPSKEYSGHQINYDVHFTNEGLLYVANAYGVLEFDGSIWKKIPLPNGKSPVALSQSKEGTIYVAGDHEFGYLEKDEKGITSYHSLIHLISEEEQKQIGWMTYCVAYEDKAYFMSQGAIYVYDGQSIHIIDSSKDGKYLFIGKEKGLLYLMEYGKGIGTLNENLTVNWLKGELSQLEIKGVEKLGEEHYYFYGRNYVWEYSNGSLEQVELPGVSGSELFSDYTFSGHYKVISSEQSGVHIFDKTFQREYHINKVKGGLKSNYIHATCANSEGDLAIATSNGISILHLSASVLSMSPETNVDGAGYSALKVEDQLYLGTSQGLYFSNNWSSASPYTKAEGIKGVVYDIAYHDGKVFFGDQSDFYFMENEVITKISTKSWRGSWTIRTVPNRPNILLLGTYDGIDVYKKIDGQWQFSNKLEGYDAAGRNIELDEEGNIWVASGLEGFYYLSVDRNYSKVINTVDYCKTMKVSNDFFIELVQIDDQMYVSSYNGMYFINEKKLVKDDRFPSDLKFERIRSINGNKMFTVEEHNPIYLKEYEAKYLIDTNHILNNITIDMVGSSEFISEIDPNKFLIGTSSGFILADNSKPKNFFGEVQMSQIKSMQNDSILPLSNMQLPYKYNSISIRYGYSALESFYNITWYTRLNDGEWKQVMSEDNFKELSNLNEGVYELGIKAVSRYKTIGEREVQFEVYPPWYRSDTAKFFYVVLFIVGIIFGYVFWKKRLANLQRKLESEKERELEVQRNFYQSELLKTELQKKETKMSYLSLAHTQKKDLLTYVSNKLDKLLDLADDPIQLRRSIVSLRTSLNQKSGSKEEKDWKEFQLHFDKSNKNFIEKLKQRDPKIKESFILMCVYIRMGKNNKEIASLLNISLNTLDKRKWRLKNKYGIPKDKTLNEYLKEI